MRWVRSWRGNQSSISFLPNSRFMKLSAVIRPTKPAGVSPSGSASWKKRSVNGTPSENWRWQVSG